MNRFDIRDILNAHKEHFRALPTNAMLALSGIIQAIDIDERDKHKATVAALHEADEKAKEKKPVKKESPAKSFTTGKVAKKKAKKKGK